MAPLFSRKSQTGPTPPGGDVAGPAERGTPAGARDRGKYEFVVQPEILGDSTGKDPNAESFRRLRTVLADGLADPPRTIVVTSPLPAEGKSFVALNLALTFSRKAEGRTLLIDGDLRRATHTRWLRPHPVHGLTDVLLNQATIDEVLVEMRNCPLVYLAKGGPVDDAILQFETAHMRQVLTSLREKFWRVIIDTPPVLPFADAALLAGMADGVLLVVRAGRTSMTHYTEALEALESARLLGVVLNDARDSLADRSSSYGASYAHYYQASKKTSER